MERLRSQIDRAFEVNDSLVDERNSGEVVVVKEELETSWQSLRVRRGGRKRVEE